MTNVFLHRLLFLLFPISYLLSPICHAAPAAAGASDPDWRELVATGQLVEIKRIDPTIVIDMRYGTANNCVGAPLYSPDMPCLTRPETAELLHIVEQKLRGWGYRLKIWDAYRPLTAHQKLWQKFSKHGFVADPTEGPGSLHSWGLAVDVTMVDLLGREVSMPSDFDAFTPEASAIYKGTDKKAEAHLKLLQAAMGDSGFFGLTTEWWHFAVRDWYKSKPLAVPSARPASIPSAQPEQGAGPINTEVRKPRSGS